MRLASASLAFVLLALAGWLWLGREPDTRTLQVASPEVAGLDATDGLASRAGSLEAPERAAAVPVTDPLQERIAADSADAPATELGSRDEPEAPERELWLDGRVVDEASEPIEGARLELLGDLDGAKRTLLAVSDAEGRLQNTDDAPGEQQFLTLEVLADGYERQAIQLRSGSGKIALGIVSLERGVAAEGTVVGPNGEGIERSQVHWLPASAARIDLRERGWGHLLMQHRAHGHHKAWSDARGAFRLAHLPNEPGFLAARAPGYAFGWTEVRKPSHWDTPARITLELGQELVPIRGSVVSRQGAPLEGIHVVIYGAGDAQERFTEASGRFEFLVPTGNDAMLRITDPATRHYGERLDDVAPGTTDLVVRMSELRHALARVVDPEGQAVPWSSIRAPGKNTVPESYAADRSGTVEFVVPRKTFKVQAFAPGFRSESLGPFEPDQVGDVLVLPLEPGDFVAGRVTFQGRPVAGARVARSETQEPGGSGVSRNVTLPEYPFDVLGRGRCSGYDAETDEHGRFVMSLANDGWHSLYVTAKDLPPTVFGPFAWNRGAGVRGIELEIARGGSLEGRVLVPAGEPKDGRIVAISNGWGVAYTTSTDATGRYRFDNVQPGNWQVRLARPPLGPVEPLFSGSFSDEPVPVEWDVYVGPGGTTSFDLDLNRPEHVLEGRLRLDGRGAEGWSASLYVSKSNATAFGTFISSSQLDTEGRFELRSLRGGELRLAIRRGREVFFATVVMAEGHNTWELDVPTGSVELSKAPDVKFVIGPSLQARVGDAMYSQVLSPRDFEPTRRIDDIPAGPAFVSRIPMAIFFREPTEVFQTLEVVEGATTPLHVAESPH